MGQFINSFENGMVKDNDPSLQPPGTYRNMINCTLISQDGHNYVVKDCNGNVKVFAINCPYDGVETGSARPPVPLVFISFPDKMIVISTNFDDAGVDDDGGYGAIGKFDYLPYGEGIQPKIETYQSNPGNFESNPGYTPLYHSLDLNLKKQKRIEAFPSPENDRVQNIYFTDNFNEPRVFNVADERYTTYFTSGGASLNPISATVGVKYMILQGAVKYAGVDLGPGMGAGNIITTTGSQVWTNLRPGTTPLIIEYVPYQLLSWTPDKTLGNIQFESYGSGSVYCGNKVYLYRLGLNDGYRTSWSYPSAPVHITQEQETDYKAGNLYHDTVGDGTAALAVASDKSVNITIDQINTDFDTIEMACIEFDQSWITPRLISIVAVENITGDTMALEHDGLVNNGTLTLADLTLFPASILKVKTLTTNKNYNLIANLTEREELDIDVSGVTLSSFEYPMPVFGDPQSCDNLMSYDAPLPVTGANPGAGTILPDSRYLVTHGEASVNTVIYNGHTYLTGEVVTGLTGFPTIAFAGTGACRPCVTKNRYTPYGTSDRVENAIQLTSNDGIWDYKSAVVDQHLRGYWSGEKYRLAFLPLDLKGNPFYARHIGDITMPTIRVKSGLMIERTFGGQPCYSLNPSGIKVSGLVIPAELIDQISGFLIVRAVRDPRIICQGIVGQCSFDSGLTMYRPTAWSVPAADKYPAAGPDSSSDSLYTFISPDHLVNLDMKGQFGQVGDTLEMAAWLDAVDYGTTYVKSKNNGQSVQSMFILPLTSSQPLQSSTITFWSEFNEAEGASNFDGGGNNWQNTLYTDTVGSGVVITDDTCISGVSTNLGDRNAQSGRKCVFKRTDNILQYSSANAYNSSAEVGNPKKILMNYCVSNTSQYGGSSDAAIANTLYISTGHYQPITAQVKADTQNGSGDYEFNDIEIFGGDCFTSMVDYGYGLWDDTLSDPNYSYGWFFPCESSANYGLRRGRKVSGVELYYDDGVDPGTKPTAQAIAYFISGNGTRLEGLEYNPGYTSEGQIIKYPGLPLNYLFTDRFPNRVRFAGPKFAGETTDSFRTFLTNDYRDLNAQAGEINKIAVKDDRVIVWQNMATNTVPILERQILSGQDGAATTLGTGGVVDRFDVISSSCGLQHQWSVIETDYGFAWFDMRKKEFMIYDHGLGQMSSALGIKSFFDTIFIEARGLDVNSAKLLNSPTWAETSDRPLMGVGITGVYDPKTRMTYMTFKFKDHYKVAGNYNYIDKDFTIGYFHPKKMFVSFYTWTPCIAHNHNNFVVSCNNPQNTTKYFGVNMPSTAFVAGEWAVYDATEYICILAVTVASYPAFASDPTAPPTDTTHWQPVNSMNELWIHNQPTTMAQSIAPALRINSFFGKVVNNEVEFIVNPKTQNPFNVQHIEQSTPTNVNYTDVYIEAGSQTASDLSIKTWNKNYRYIYNMLCSSLPLSTRGRIVNNYLKIRFVKKNWTTDPRVITGATKILEYVKSFFVEKR